MCGVKRNSKVMKKKKRKVRKNIEFNMEYEIILKEGDGGRRKRNGRYD